MSEKKLNSSMSSSEVSDASLDSVSGGNSVQLDHVSSQGVKWYSVTNGTNTIKVNDLNRANQLASNPNDPSWRIAARQKH